MTEKSPENNLPAGYELPKVWTWDKGNGGAFASINRPTAGPTHEKKLPIGKHPLQLYSLATPNGQKVTIMLEELLAAGHKGAEYDAWLIKIGDGDQFGSGFVEVNPNSKIPALMDRSTSEPTRVFESGSILVYLAEKFGAFIPADHKGRTETMNWLFWQMGSAPFLGGGFGHFLPMRRCTSVCDRSLFDGSEAPARRARPTSCRSSVHGGFGIFDRRYGNLALVRQARAQPVLWRCWLLP
jgi:GST-like protein